MNAHVIVALDGSEAAKAILPFVRDLEPAQATLVRVIDHAELGPAAERDIARTAESLGRDGFGEVRAVVRTGRAADEILRLAAETGASAIAMTEHGSTGFDR